MISTKRQAFDQVTVKVGELKTEKAERMREPIEPVRSGKIQGLDRAVFTKILVVIDGSKNAARSLKVAVKMAKRDAAEVVVVCVVPRPSYLFGAVSGSVPPMGEYYDYARKNAEKWVNEAVLMAKGRNVEAKGHV